MHNCGEKLVRLVNTSWLATSLLIASLFGKHDESVCIWTGSYLGFPFKHQLLFKAHFILLSLHRSYCPENELNTPYPDANLTEIISDLLSFYSFLCKISVCHNFFHFWIPKSWLTIFSQCSLPSILSQENKEHFTAF